MARLYDVPLGKFTEFQRALATAGLDSAMVDHVLRSPESAKEWVNDLRQQLIAHDGHEELFRSPLVIEALFRERAQLRQWPFSAEQLTALREQRPVNFKSRLNKALSLEIWLGDEASTVAEHLDWCADVYGSDSILFQNALNSKDRYVRLRDVRPTYLPSRSSVRWVEIDLTDRYAHASEDARGKNSAAFELLAAVALHTGWVKAIDRNTVPAVWAAGLEAYRSEVTGWSDAPYIEWLPAPGVVRLSSAPACEAVPGYAVPTVKFL